MSSDEYQVGETLTAACEGEKAVARFYCVVGDEMVNLGSAI